MKFLTACIALVFFTGCSSIYKTHTDNQTSDPPPEGNGIYYFLPKGLIQITAKESFGSSVEATVEETISSSDTVEDAGPPKTNNVSARATKTTSQKYTARQSLGVNISVSPIIEADKTTRRFLRYNPNILHKDVIKLRVNNLGLLETANATTTDETATVLTNMAKIAGRLVRVTETFATGDGTPKAPPKKSLNIDTVIDPLDRNAVYRLQEEFASFGYEFHIEEFPKVCDTAKSLPQAAECGQDVANHGHSSKPTVGIQFRRPKVYSIRIHPTGQLNNQKRWSILLPSGDEGIYASIPTRGSFIQKTTDLTIINGMLTGIDISKPSELAAASGIPVAILDEIISSFEGLITVKVNHATSQNALLDQQLRQLEIERKLIEAESALDAARKAAR
jgi:hypothetical protein